MIPIYAIDRTHKKILYSQEFQHHGIIGQRWGIITRNVGVNYIPIGQQIGSSSNSDIIRQRKINNEIDNRCGLSGIPYANKLPKGIKDGVYQHLQNSRFAKNTNNMHIIKASIDHVVSKAEQEFNRNFNKYCKERGAGNSWSEYNKLLKEYKDLMYSKNSLDVTEAFGWSKSDCLNGVQLKALMINGIPVEYGWTYNNKWFASRTEANNASKRNLN